MSNKKKDNPPERTRQSATAPSRNPNPWTALVALAILGAPIAAVAQSARTVLEVGADDANLLAPTFAAIVLVIALNGLFVAAEAAIEGLRPTHIRLFEKDPKRAGLVQNLIQGRARYTAGCTLGSQTMRAWMIILCFFPAPWLASRLAESGSLELSWGSILMCAIALSLPVAALNMVFGEMVPHSYGVLRSPQVAIRLFALVRTFTFVFSLPSKALVATAGLVTKRFGGSASFANGNQAEEEIRNLVESAQESGEIEQEERELLHSVFEFTDTVAREVMTPRVDMDAVPITADPSGIIEMIQDTGHSRIPVYENTDDQIIGIVHAKDLLMLKVKSSDKPLNLRTILRPALFVPENKNLHDLLREMRQNRSQMAIVQDEFGGTAGIVTIEDIVEELVGDIVDEYDTESADVVSVDQGFLVSGKINLYDLNDEIGSEFESEEFDTLGGYVFGLFGRQPKSGEEIFDETHRFLVEETDGRRIMRVRIEPLLPQSTQATE